MEKYILLPILFFMFGFGLIQCLPMEKKYDYGIEVTSADGYRCMISWSDCYLGVTQIPFSASGSWGKGNASMACGPKMKPLPDTIRLIYYSPAEDQFYKLRSEIDKEKIFPLLNARYKQEEYEDASFFVFTVGIAPGGFVSLWLSGDAGQILIDTFHAEKTHVDIRQAFPTGTWDREETFHNYSGALYPFIRKEMADGSISSAYWESLNKSYKWMLVFNDPRFSLYDYDIYLLNQENRMHLTNPMWPMIESNKFIPVQLILYIKHKLDPIRYKVVIELRDPSVVYEENVEEEITVLNYMNKSRALLRFFDSFYQKAGEKDVSLYIDFDDSMESLKLKLKAADYEEEFPDYEFNIYDSERYDYM